jgi:ribosome-associated protein
VRAFSFDAPRAGAPRTCFPEVSLAQSARQLALRAIELAQSKKAEDITLMDLREVTNFADYFVLCTAHSDAQMKAVADAIQDGLAEEKHKVWHAEGYEVRSWILLDYVQVVVHVFLPETRSYYALERLWGDAPTETFGD